VIRAAALAAGLLALPAAAFAQTSNGPMLVEQVHDGFLVAPDFKVTDIDHTTSGLAGGYAGIVLDEHLFIGAGAYVLATDRRGRDLAYGGVVLQWFGGSDTFGFSVKTLLGGGGAESSGNVQVLDRGHLAVEPFRNRQGFLVAEPEVDARIRIAPHVRVALGAGYRFAGSDRRRAVFFSEGGRMRLDGAVGSIGLQIGGGS
jgi:hypothetical protein